MNDMFIDILFLYDTDGIVYYILMSYNNQTSYPTKIKHTD